MLKFNNEKEQIILEAAENIFIKKGLEGARMQEIADQAKINKSLLHYYYRSKDNLFNAVFTSVVKRLFPKTISNIKSEDDLFKKIEMIVEAYFKLLSKHSMIPLFVLHEINRNPKEIVKVMREVLANGDDNIISHMRDEVNKAISQGLIRSIKAEHLLINIISLSIFPVMAQPLMQAMLFDDNKKSMKQFLKERKDNVSKFIIDSIKL